MRVILICSCFNMDKKAREVFSVLFLGESLPQIIKGKDNIYKFSQDIKNEHIKAISRLSSKFAYFVEMDGDSILREYDLVRGTRIA